MYNNKKNINPSIFTFCTCFIPISIGMTIPRAVYYLYLYSNYDVINIKLGNIPRSGTLYDEYRVFKFGNLQSISHWMININMAIITFLIICLTIGNIVVYVLFKRQLTKKGFDCKKLRKLGRQWSAFCLLIIAVGALWIILGVLISINQFLGIKFGTEIPKDPFVLKELRDKKFIYLNLFDISFYSFGVISVFVMVYLVPSRRFKKKEEN